ncbi:hypothetical protein JCM6882_004698 [Rhodosporidiobolus microsporus]
MKSLALLTVLAGALAPVEAVRTVATGDLSAVTDLLNTTSFDYLVVGGGNAGLAVASRLAAGNSSYSVLVLEAGHAAIGNLGVDVPGLAGSSAFHSSVDWDFYTTPQPNANNRSVYWPRGKMLGGSSGLNFLASTRPNTAEQDQWATLNDDSGWSWSSLLPFYQKAEHFFEPGPSTQNESTVFNASLHGTSGPIEASYPPYLSPQFGGFYDSLRSLDVPVAEDLHSGENHGVSYAPSTMHHRGTDRSRAYSIDYLDIAPNLVVMTGAQATRINWKSGDNSTESVVAQGVSFVPSGGAGPELVVNATREVILSAGSIQSPQLLELSGVGDPDIINPFNISTVVDLPGVGKNLQDHPAIVDVFELKEGAKTLDALTENPGLLAAALDEFALGDGILTQALHPLAYLTVSDFTNTSDLDTLSSLKSSDSNPQLSAKLWNASQSLFDDDVPVMELLAINTYFGINATGQPGKSYLSIAACLQHSLSIGSVHINSTNATAPPSINSNYLQAPLDLFLLKRAGQYLRRLAQQPALATYVVQEAEPGPAVQTEEQWEEYVRETMETEYHPIGTCSLLPRSDGGVVSPSLKVYGTSNVRVVDLSIAPLHVSSHTQTVAYAIAEKAADLILSGQ